MIFDQSKVAELEQQYNVARSRVDLEMLMRDWENRSEVYRISSNVEVDCQYGENERELLDIFHGSTDTGPILVFLHGGYWQRGEKSIYSLLAKPFGAAGINVIVVGYPLCPVVTMSEIFNSIQRAIIWLWENAEHYGLDSRRINLCGHSAGGHLATMALTTNWAALAENVPDDIIKSAIPISGLYQLAPLRHTTIAGPLGLDDDETNNLSPASLQPVKNIPVLVALGGDETDEFHRQADHLVSNWSRCGITLEKHIEDGADHFDIINRLADERSEIFQRILGWLR